MATWLEEQKAKIAALRRQQQQPQTPFGPAPDMTLGGGDRAQFNQAMGLREIGNEQPAPQQPAPQQAAPEMTQRPEYRGMSPEQAALRDQFNKEETLAAAQQRYNTDDKYHGTNLLNSPVAWLLNKFGDEEGKVSGYQADMLRGLEAEQQYGDMEAQRAFESEMDVTEYEQDSQTDRTMITQIEQMRRQLQQQGYDTEKLESEGELKYFREPGGGLITGRENRGEVFDYMTGEKIDITGLSEYVPSASGTKEETWSKEYVDQVDPVTGEETRALGATSNFGNFKMVDTGEGVSIPLQVGELPYDPESRETKRELDLMETEELTNLENELAMGKINDEDYQEIRAKYSNDEADVELANKNSYDTDYQGIEVGEQQLADSSQLAEQMLPWISNASAGLIAEWTSGVGGTYTHALETQIETLKNRGLLARMEDLQERGVSLYPFSDSDAARLAAAHGALGVEDNPALLRDRVEHYIFLEQQMLDNAKTAFQRKHRIPYLDEYANPYDFSERGLQ